MIFWWDNFDKNLDKSAGGGSMHIAPGKVGKEPVSDTQCLKEIVLLIKTLPWYCHQNQRSIQKKIVLSHEPFHSDAKFTFKELLTMFLFSRVWAVNKRFHVNLLVLWLNFMQMRFYHKLLWLTYHQYIITSFYDLRTTSTNTYD